MSEDLLGFVIVLGIVYEVIMVDDDMVAIGAVEEGPGVIGEAIVFESRVSPVADGTRPGIVSRKTRIKPASCGLSVLERHLRSLSANLNTV